MLTRQQLSVFLQHHFCGCGNPEGAVDALYRILDVFGDDEKAGYIELPKFLPDDGAKFLLLYLIDRMEPNIIEHGGGIQASWLTKRGKLVLEALSREKEDDFAALMETRCVHGFAVDGSEKDHDCGKWEDEHPEWEYGKPRTWGWT